MGLVKTIGMFSRRLLPVDDGSLTVNGTRLGSIGWWLTADAVEVADAAPVTSFATVPGMSGSADQTLTDEMGFAYVGRRTVTCHLRTLGGETDAVKSMQDLAAFHGADVQVRWRALPGAFVGRASLENRADVWRSGRYAYTECDLVVDAEPVVFADAVTESVPSSTLVFAGNRPAWPTFTLKATGYAAKASVSDGRGHTVTVQPSNAVISTGSSIVMDFGNRRCAINGNLVMPTLDSDFFRVLPGRSTITTVGASSATVTYSPAWMI